MSGKAQAVFTQGSTLRHIVLMTGASTVGLLTLFTVDLVDMYFLSLLGHEELAAAIGFAGTLLFFLTSLSIGLQIGMGALVARAEGAHNREQAGRYCTSVLGFSAILSTLVCLPAWFFLPELLSFLGARGDTLAYAHAYARILLPGTPVLAVGMCAAAALRSVGDARRSMLATTSAALANAVLDPILIFGLDWGIEGAAAASLVSRFVVLGVAFLPLWRVHRLPAAVSLANLVADLRDIIRVAGPAMLTNLATPIGGAYVLKTMSSFGDSAVAGAAILGRIAPVAFAGIFALSSAIGPIVGQNAGAGLYARVRLTLLNALLFNLVYVLLVWGALFALCDWIILVFDASGEAARLIRVYTHILVGGFVFNGMLFIANASFNNLQRAHMATLFSFGRIFLGTIPLVFVFSAWWGPPGVLAGEMAGAFLFGLLAMAAVWRQIGKMDAAHELVRQQQAPAAPDWPFSSSRTQLGSKACPD